MVARPEQKPFLFHNPFKVSLRKAFELRQNDVGVPELNPVLLSSGGNDPVSRVLMLPWPQCCLPGDRLGNRQNLETIQALIQPGRWLRAEQLAGVPFAHDFHTRNRTKKA